MTSLRPDWATPPPDRFAPDDPRFDEAIHRHDHAVDAGHTTYVDPTTGYHVMTAPMLAARPCCDNGCRHCPWDRPAP